MCQDVSNGLSRMRAFAGGGGGSEIREAWREICAAFLTEIKCPHGLRAKIEFWKHG